MPSMEQITRLKNRHAHLKQMIAEEERRAYPKRDIISRFKREKLIVKDRLAEIQRNNSTTSIMR